MEINIEKGEMKYLEDCYDALINSEIGKTYFMSFDSKSMLAEGIKNGGLYVVLDSNNECIGFVWYEAEGTFGMHAFLHIIAIKEKFRNKGIGTKVLLYFEEKAFSDDNWIFLMVAEFNTKARKLYDKLGYKQVGILPDFYRPGVNECLMMKTQNY